MTLDCGCVVTIENNIKLTSPLCPKHKEKQMKSTGVPTFLIKEESL